MSTLLLVFSIGIIAFLIWKLQKNKKTVTTIYQDPVKTIETSTEARKSDKKPAAKRGPKKKVQ